jgi:hypothetical protein
MRGAVLLALLLLLAGCIDKPGLPSDRADGGDGAGDGGDGDGGGGECNASLDTPTAWTDDDQIRFDRDVGKINPDCLEDLVIPGEKGAGDTGVFVVLGRPENVLVDGYDSFVDTNDRVPVDVKLANFVGDDALDLLVLASEDIDAVGLSTVVLVYEGDGEGGFRNGPVENTVEGQELIIGDFDSPQPLYIEPVPLDPAGEISLVFGDSQITRLLSPPSWNDNDGVLNSVEIAPGGFGQGQDTTVVFPIESGTINAYDLVQLTQTQLNWCALVTPDSFASDNIDDTVASGVGRADVGDIDQDSKVDVAYSRNQSVFVNLLRPTDQEGEPGDDEDVPFAPVPEFDVPPDSAFEDIQIASIDEDGRGDLLLVDSSDDGTVLWIYPNLDPAGASIVNQTDGLSHTTTGVTPGEFRLNRAIAGHFSDPDALDVLLVGSKPNVVKPECVRVGVVEDAVDVQFCP